MQQIIKLFSDQYGLTKSEVMAEIEKVFSDILSGWYGFEVMTIFHQDLQLEAVAYNKVGGVLLQRNIEFQEVCR